VTIQQLVVDLENEPGRLFTVTEAIARSGINVHALTLCDGAASGTARMLVSDVRRARAIVMELDVPARTEEVLVLLIPDSPGSLAELLEPLFDDYVNITYLNAFSEIDGRAVSVVRFNDNTRAEGILREHGHIPLALDTIFPVSGEEE
jgi:hypothetical protein